MKKSVTCPMCQAIFEWTSRFSTTCPGCSTYVHADESGKIRCYFVDANIGEKHYQLAFYIYDSLSYPDNTFVIEYYDKDSEKNKWVVVLKLSFIPRINHANMMNKLKTLLTFM